MTCTACYTGECRIHQGTDPAHPDLDPSTPIGFLRKRLMDLEREFIEYKKTTDATIAECAAAVEFIAETLGTLKAQFDEFNQRTAWLSEHRRS